MKILNVEQGTQEWLDARRCVITGTRLGDVMGTSLAQVQLISELIAEEMTEQSKTMRVTAEMERGTMEEPFAVTAFQAKTGKVVDRVGFCISDKYDWIGYSPDGFIGQENNYTEGIEIKNPNSDTAVFYRLTNEVGMEKLDLGSWSKITKTNLVSEFTPSSKAPFLGIPADYKWQIVQSFIVNEKLQKMYFLVHDARVVDETKKLYVIEVSRENELMQDAINEAMERLIKFRELWLYCRDVIIPNNF